MLHELIHGWNRIEALSGSSILIYADCRKSLYAVELDQILASLAQDNAVFIVVDGTYIVPSNAKKHVKLLSLDEVKYIHDVDAAITLGKPKPEFLHALSGKPDVVFAACSDAV